MKEHKKLKVGLSIVDNKTIRILNKKYLHRNTETDVIAFDIKEKTPDGYYFLGDIVISLDQAKSQANKYSVSEVTEFTRLITHGILHLFGYEDGNQKQKEKMTRIEDLTIKSVLGPKGSLVGVDYIGVSVGAIIINEEGKIFLSLRGKNVRNESGKWEFPGGSIEFNETLEEAIVREIKEEYGFDTMVKEFLHVSDHIIPNEKQHWVATTFICCIKRGSPKIMEPQKCKKIGWYSISEIGKLNLSVITKIDLAMLKKKFPKELPNYYN